MKLEISPLHPWTPSTNTCKSILVTSDGKEYVPIEFARSLETMYRKRLGCFYCKYNLSGLMHPDGDEDQVYKECDLDCICKDPDSLNYAWRSRHGQE